MSSKIWLNLYEKNVKKYKENVMFPSCVKIQVTELINRWNGKKMLVIIFKIMIYKLYVNFHL